jgi:hypothetical protein
MSPSGRRTALKIVLTITIWMYALSNDQDLDVRASDPVPSNCCLVRVDGGEGWRVFRKIERSIATARYIFHTRYTSLYRNPLSQQSDSLGSYATYLRSSADGTFPKCNGLLRSRLLGTRGG